MARTNLLKGLGLSDIELRSRWCISSNKKRLVDMILEKEAIKEPFTLKEKKRFLIFSLTCEICKETRSWDKARKEAKGYVESLSNESIHNKGTAIIRKLRKTLDGKKNGLSKRRKSSKTGVKQ